MNRTSTDPEAVRQAFERTGLGWVLQCEGETDQVARQVAREIDEFVSEYESRFGETPEPFALLDENPDKGVAFFEAFIGPPLSVDMRIVVWRLLYGADIVALQLKYDQDQGTLIEVAICHGPRGRDRVETYQSDNLWDFEVLRHFGILAVDGKPILDGYYPSRPLG